MKEDGTLMEGEGNEKMFKAVLRTGGIIDGDVTWNGTTHNIFYKGVVFFEEHNDRYHLVCWRKSPHPA